MEIEGYTFTKDEIAARRSESWLETLLILIEIYFILSFTALIFSLLGHKDISEGLVNMILFVTAVGFLYECLFYTPSKRYIYNLAWNKHFDFNSDLNIEEEINQYLISGAYKEMLEHRDKMCEARKSEVLEIVATCPKWFLKIRVRRLNKVFPNKVMYNFYFNEPDSNKITASYQLEYSELLERLKSLGVEIEQETQNE